jgi:hypothetical protein
MDTFAIGGSDAPGLYPTAFDWPEMTIVMAGGTEVVAGASRRASSHATDKRTTAGIIAVIALRSRIEYDRTGSVNRFHRPTPGGLAHTWRS